MDRRDPAFQCEYGTKSGAAHPVKCQSGADKGTGESRTRVDAGAGLDMEHARIDPAGLQIRCKREKGVDLTVSKCAVGGCVAVRGTKVGEKTFCPQAGSPVYRSHRVNLRRGKSQTMHSGIHSHMEPEGFSKGGKLFGVDGICNSKDEVSAVRFGEFRRKCPPQHQNITFDPGTPQGLSLIHISEPTRRS